MYEENLEQFGLTRGEAKVYEALLVLGSSTVGPIVMKANVAHSNIYEILNRLLEKGLVSFNVKEKTKYFQAVDPTRIKEYLEKKELDLKKSKQVFDSILPGLEKLKNFIKTKEESEIFIGEKGLMTAYQYLLKGTDKSNEGVFFDEINRTPEKYYEMAEKFYIKSWHLLRKFRSKWKGISNESRRKTKLVKAYPSFIEQRYVDYPVPGNIDVINDKTLITVWGEKPIGILIQSQQVADNFRNYFYYVWDQAKK